MIQTRMTEEQLHTTWDVLKELVGENPFKEYPSEFLTKCYRRGLLTFDEAMDMYMCAIGMATTDSLEAECLPVK